MGDLFTHLLLGKIYVFIVNFSFGFNNMSHYFFVSRSDLSKKEFFVIQEKIESKTTIKKRMKIKLFIFLFYFLLI